MMHLQIPNMIFSCQYFVANILQRRQVHRDILNLYICGSYYEYKNSDHNLTYINNISNESNIFLATSCFILIIQLQHKIGGKYFVHF